MKKITLTCAHAIEKYLIAQKILINGKKEPLFPGVFGIFGHGNVACLGQALEENQNELPTYRGHHEQNMALTGIGYARAKRRQQIFVATSSVGLTPNLLRVSCNLAKTLKFRSKSTNGDELDFTVSAVFSTFLLNLHAGSIWHTRFYRLLPPKTL